MREFKKGFFEYIAAADAEKVHSQMIGWMFSKDCDVFEDEEKSKILNELIPKAGGIQLIPKKVHVEINDIDILIEGEDWLIVIENKIKSSQHSNQLFKYEFLTAINEEEKKESFIKWKSLESIEDDLESSLEQNGFHTIKRLKLDNAKKIFYMYLTLTKEVPVSTKWENITYSSFYDISNKILNLKPEKSTKDFLILTEYLKSINNLTLALDFIVDKPDVRKWVFEHGDYSKKQIFEDEKFSTYNPEIQYIAETGLVRFMQKYYYTRVCGLFGGVNKEINWNGINIKCIAASSASNGSGLIQIFFQDTEFSHGNNKFIFGCQVGGNTVKLNCLSTNYADSNYNELPKGIETKFLELLQLTELKNGPVWSIRQKVNDTAKSKAKAYISITKNFNKETMKLTALRPGELALLIKNELPILFNSALQIKQSYG